MVRLSRLEIQVVVGESVDHPRVVLLVDGRDVLGWRGDRGFDPEALLRRGDPLTPRDPPRRMSSTPVTARARGMARPIPRPPPVTNATRPPSVTARQRTAMAVPSSGQMLRSVV